MGSFKIHGSAKEPMSMSLETFSFCLHSSMGFKIPIKKDMRGRKYRIYLPT